MQVIAIYTIIFNMSLQCSQYMQLKNPEKLTAVIILIQ